jgi:hypothetical protein
MEKDKVISYILENSLYSQGRPFDLNKQLKDNQLYTIDEDKTFVLIENVTTKFRFVLRRFDDVDATVLYKVGPSLRPLRRPQN